ncbi:MAG: trypsin-like peptidase domain-containing protein [Pseudomonadota bacterium]
MNESTLRLLTMLMAIAIAITAFADERQDFEKDQFNFTTRPENDKREPVIDRLLNGEYKTNPQLFEAYKSVLWMYRPSNGDTTRQFSGVLTESNDTVVTSAHEIFSDYPENNILHSNVNEILAVYTHDLEVNFIKHKVVGVIPYIAPHKSARGKDLVVLKIEPFEEIKPRKVRVFTNEELARMDFYHVAFHGDVSDGEKKMVQRCEAKLLRDSNPFPEEKSILPTTCSVFGGSSGGGVFPLESTDYPLVALQRGFYGNRNAGFAYSTVIDQHAADFIVGAAKSKVLLPPVR